ncbi:hypothetical protein A0257_03120 [Hymenobacter psoromatis]|nr:hypothetical protein A0257_03120 [Hymenobacter psoromatis]
MPTVTELRRGGQLAEALAQGLAELAAKPTDVWAKRNLAWVYHDQLKGLTSENSFGFLQALAAVAKLGLGPEEEMLYPNLIWQVVRRLYALAKASYPIAGWVKVQVNEQDTWTRSSLPGSDSRARHQTEAHQLLAQVARFPYAIASEPHSALLKATLHFKEKACPLKLLLARPLADALRPEDYQGEEYQGKKQMPLAEQAYMALARELLAEASQHQANIAAFLPQLAAAIGQHPSYQWLPFFKAKLQLSTGDAAAALPTLLPVVRQKSGEFWAWNLLAETLEPTDPAAALACLYKASACGSEEKFLGKLRLKLARLLADTHPGEARWQLEKAQATYAAEGWNTKGETLLLAAQLANHPPAPAETARREWLALAEQTTYGDLPWQPVVLQAITDETPEKMALARLLPAGLDARPMSVPLKKYRWLQKLPLGSPLQVRSEVVAERLRVVQLIPRPGGQLWDTRLTAQPAPTAATATKAFEGILRVQAAGFGFVEGVFIPARFVSQQDWQTGQMVRGIAVAQFDQKKGKDGWAAQQVEAAT